MSPTIDVFEQNRRLGRGVNIIGYDPLWLDKSRSRFKEKHFRLIREAGFQHVRINLHPFRHMGEAPQFKFQPEWINTLDWAVEHSLKNGLGVVLDMHEFGALGHDPHGLKPKFVATWQQLAERYHDAPDSVIFEILNEPNQLLTPAIWNEYLKEPYELVRQSNPQRTLIIGPAWWNGIDYLHELQLPAQDRNIIVTVHYYHPMRFTHQGAAWTPEYKDLSGVVWLGIEEEKQAVIRDLSRAQTWAERENRPLYLGEFGAYDRAEMASRARYTRFIARQAEQMEWSWAYWQFDSDFVVYDIDRDAWVEPIRDALVGSGE